jgi:hypothetical protein
MKVMAVHYPQEHRPSLVSTLVMRHDIQLSDIYETLLTIEPMKMTFFGQCPLCCCHYFAT